MEKEMKKIWFDPEEPAGFAGLSSLAKAVKVSKKQTKSWLSDQLAYSLHRPMKKRFPTRKYLANGVDSIWQMDLLEMIPFAKINKGYKYILNCIDVFSRFVRAIPLKSKSAKDVAAALELMLKNKQPKHIQTDLGKEFYNSAVKAVLKKYDINHYSVFSQYKAALVERFNRTLRNRLTKYLTSQGNKIWINVLQKIIHAYNHTSHRGIKGMRPVDVSDVSDVHNVPIKKKGKPKYKVGEFVRISKISASPFVKNFDQNWSDEVFQISDINTKQSPVMYVIRDENNDIIQGKFYEEELQVLPRKPDIYRIQSILRRKGKGKDKQFLVKWYGYSTPSWIYASQIQ